MFPVDAREPELMRNASKGKASVSAFTKNGKRGAHESMGKGTHFSPPATLGKLANKSECFGRGASVNQGCLSASSAVMRVSGS